MSHDEGPKEDEIKTEASKIDLADLYALAHNNEPKPFNPETSKQKWEIVQKMLEEKIKHAPDPTTKNSPNVEQYPWLDWAYEDDLNQSSSFLENYGHLADLEIPPDYKNYTSSNVTNTLIGNNPQYDSEASKYDLDLEALYADILAKQQNKSKLEDGTSNKT